MGEYIGGGVVYPLRTWTLALVAVFAALYAVGSLLPGFPMIGVPDSKIDVTRALEMSYGLILGPVFGPAAAFLGAVIGKGITGGGSGLLFTPLAPVTAFAASCLGRKRVFRVPGWVLGSLPLAVFLLVWFATDTGRVAAVAVVPHVAALGVALVLRGKTAEWVDSGERGKLVTGVLVVSLVGTMTGHILGGLLFIVLFSPSPLLFLTILPVVIVERSVLVAISTLVGAPLIVAVRRFYPSLKDL
jgi:hypothetical protein